jgi:predicted DNA binding CopG/RHH family protein
MSKRATRSKKEIPSFANEDQERRFWAKEDTADYFDWGKAVQPTLPALKPTTTAISLRLPVAMLEDLKSLANKRDVPYQSLMKLYLSERIGRERTKKAS